jgi:hypothetical protein
VSSNVRPQKEVIMPEKLLLLSGREIQLAEIWQESTYDGVVEGLPNSYINRNIVEQLRIDPKYKLHGYTPHVLPPLERPIELPHPYSLGRPMLLPSVKCIARFRSSSPTEEGAGDYSTMAVAWFQDQFALPIEASVVQQLLEMDWNSLATNDSWF